MKIITVETLKKFLDELNKKYGTEFYTKAEIDAKYQLKGGASVEDFYQWLKERNYDLTNFQGLEGVFPVKDFPELKTANLAGGDTKIAGTGAPHTIVEYDGKQAQIGNDGHFVFKGITPLVDGDLIEIICYDYAGRKKTFSVPVGNFKYAVPEGTTEIAQSTVGQYTLNRAGKLVFPPSVKSVEMEAFKYCDNLTSVSMPACTIVKLGAFLNCWSLTSVSLPACTNVGESAFGGDRSLTSVFLPACTNVGTWAFNNCNELQEVTLSDGWTPNSDARFPTTATVYNQDKTKKVDWDTMTWVNV